MVTVLAHEYGHHVALNRLNPPWSAVAYGPKRWASAAHVCRLVASGRAFPGDEADHYAENPGEAWAQVYATAVQSLQGWPAGFWPTVGPWEYDIAFVSTPRALTLAYLDATEPWTTADAIVERWTGRLTPARPSASDELYPAYDGTLIARAARPADAVLTLRDATDGRLLARGLGYLAFTICGQRDLLLRVSGGANQRYDVTVSTP